MGELSVLGANPNTTEGDPVELCLVLHSDDAMETGIWESTPGSFKGGCDGYHEVFQVVTGDATLTEPDGTEHQLAPGVAMVCPDGWQGDWTVRETLRKTYVIVKNP